MLDAECEAGEAFIASQRHEGWRCLPARYDGGGLSGANTEHTVDALDARGRRTKSWVMRSGKPHEGIPWDKQSVHLLLTSITYTGRVLYEGEVHGGEHAPIIDEETFGIHAVQRSRDGMGAVRSRY